MSRTHPLARCLLLVLSVVALSMFTAGCGSSAETGSNGAPPPPETSLTAVRVEPNPLRPGAEFDAFYDPSVNRGVAANLHYWESGEWSGAVFLLSSDGATGGPSAVRIAEFPDLGVDGVGMGGPGPDRYVLPDEISPGHWRLCLVNVSEEVCGQLEVFTP